MIKKSQLDAPVNGVICEKAADEYRVLFVGNSITLHAFSDDTIARLGWTHQAGMAASCEENGYAHRFSAMLRERLPGRDVRCFFHTCGGGGSVALRLSAVDEVRTVKPDLVVIQMGEHEHEKDGEEQLRNNYRELICSFDCQNPSPQVICIGLWNPDEESSGEYRGWSARVDEVMHKECIVRDIPFISVEKYALDPACRGWGAHPGVRWHPNDKGHLCYANELMDCFNGFCKMDDEEIGCE